MTSCDVPEQEHSTRRVMDFCCVVVTDGCAHHLLAMGQIGGGVEAREDKSQQPTVSRGGVRGFDWTVLTSQVLGRGV